MYVIVFQKIFFLKNIFLFVLNYFNVLILKINLKNKKYFNIFLNKKYFLKKTISVTATK